MILIDILCQPNPRNLFLRFKEKVDGDKEWCDGENEKFIYAGNNLGCPEDLEYKMITVFEDLVAIC